MHNGMRKALLGAGVATLAMALSTQAFAQQRRFDIPAQDAATAVTAFGLQADVQISAPTGQLRGVTTPAVQGEMDARAALQMLLAGTGLVVARDDGRTIVLQMAPQGGSAGGGADEANAVEALIVTAQKREEAIQDVPIAISAFSQKALEEQKIEGGYDLLKAIPNVTFSKSNFSSYNFSIRGVGTKAVSATTDPGVAVAFNNTSLIQNRLFEQEYFDVERVEVLRGPQGTLYGRNATSGVINVISAKPDLGDFEASAKVEIGNYESRRLVGMVNVPLLEDYLGVRIAGALTKRSGYDYNEVTGNNVNGRELWSGRVTVGFAPLDNVRADLLWEHFEEDDNRSRTGKQLCHRDPGPTAIGSTPLWNPNDPDPVRKAYQSQLRPALFSQGCQPGSLYEEAAFGTPNGLALPFVFGALVLSESCSSVCGPVFPLGTEPGSGRFRALVQLQDPYGGMIQSKDLRTIASFRDPVYRAKADLVDLTFNVDITEALTVTSQTVYNEDSVYSFQDFNRFNTVPVFTDTSALLFGGAPSRYRDLAPGGVFCDPQIGCSSSLAGFDISQASGRQFSQEFRVASEFDGAVNFSAGVNYTRFKTMIDYYVFYNIITALAVTPPFNDSDDFNSFAFCGSGSFALPIDDPGARCPYVDPNPVESLNGEGHNYFRSKNPYKLKSSAAFGELYWNVADDLKLTAGIRYTQDEKSFIPVPSQVLLAPGLVAGGNVNKGYPERPAIEQEWGEYTGRLGLDWKPELHFTDATMIYGFYSRGYKGGGANPPSPGFATSEEQAAQREAAGGDPTPTTPGLFLTSVEYGRTFEPEFVDALEIGAKNTLLRGSMTLNLGAFYYDYKDYQVSQIRDRTAVNENFDAKIWGLEFETVFQPGPDLRFNANLGYLNTEIADGEGSIDTMNRTQSDPNYLVVKPWAQLPSNCVVPLPVVELWLNTNSNPSAGGLEGYNSLCGGVGPAGTTAIAILSRTIIDPNPAFGGGAQPYDYRNYPELNGGAGIKADLGGNELPNAPHWTANIGAQYGRDVLDGSWRVVMRGDAYWQAQSWARVYNAVNDKLHGWYNLNVSVRLENQDLGLEAEFYVKNLLDKSPITDAFLNSDDTALTTNVFVLDPRLLGFSIRKTF